MKRLKILLICDASIEVNSDGDYKEFLRLPECSAESDIFSALERLGHEVRFLTLVDRLEPLLREISVHPPDIIFNQVEQFASEASQEKSFIALLEMLKVPYTGTGAVGLTLCKNKGLTKEILSHHRIKTPAFQLFPKSKRIAPAKRLKYPIIVKPLREEASYGIAQSSLVENDKALIERVQFVHESMQQDTIAEEYIDGRELYVGVLGNHRLKVLPPREMVFRQVPEDEPKIATYKAKWDKNYRKKWGIQNRFAKSLPETVLKNLERICKKVYGFLFLRGYARMDIRLAKNDEIYLIEVNPNPFLAKDEDFALSAEKVGIHYDSLVQKILNFGLELN
jgi:D-alanine-D-alanine ligase